LVAVNQLQVQLQYWQTQHTKLTMCCSKRAKSRLCQHVYILVTTVLQPVILIIVITCNRY